MEQREGRMDSYADGYLAGREDAHLAAGIFLGLNGFKPTDQGWVKRFKSYTVTGVDRGPSDSAERAAYDDWEIGVDDAERERSDDVAAD